MASVSEEEDATAQLPDAPEFDLEHSANKTAPVNGTVILNCRVRHLGSLTVSYAPFRRERESEREREREGGEVER